MGNVATQIAGGLEGAIALAGAWLLIRLEFLPSAKPYKRPPELRKWDIRPDQFLLYLWTVVASVLVVSLTVGWLVKALNVGGDLGNVIAGAALHPGILIGIVITQVFILKRPPEPTAPPRTPSLLTGTATFMVSLPLIIVTSLVWNYLLTAFHLPADQQDMVDMFAGGSSTAVKLLISFMAVFVAPVTEELVFRAGIFRYFYQRTPRWVAYLVPSLLFAALHLGYNKQTHSLTGLTAVGPLVVLAVVFSIAYARTGRISTTIVAHALFNLNELVMTQAHVFTT